MSAPVSSSGGGVRERVRELLGPEGVADAPIGAAASIASADSTTPPVSSTPADATPAASHAPVATPSDPEQAAALFRVAAEEGWRVRPAGAGLGLDLLPARGDGSPPAPDLLLSTARLAGIQDYEPADLTLRAGAGTTLAALDEALRAEGQWLPLDPPGGGAPTLGGVVATGTAGPLVPGFGRPRDQLLGLGLVDGRGRDLALGGRVVKNVAGFDLVRLAAGSRGAVGLIHNVSLRLFPRPRADRTLVWPAGDRAAGVALGRRLAGLAVPLASLELLDGAGGTAGAPAGPRVLLRLVGSPAAVDRMEADACAIAGEPAHRLDGAASVEAARERSRDEGAGTPFLRLQALPDRAPALVEALDEVLGAAGDDTGASGAGAGNSADETGSADAAGPTAAGFRIAVHLTTGTVRVWWGAGGAGTPIREALGPLARRVAAAGGTARLLRLAPAARSGVEDDALALPPEPDSASRPGLRPDPGSQPGPASPPQPAVARLHADLRKAFDPDGILPGAWLEGWG